MDLRYARLIAYDIENDRRRQRVAKLLEEHGLRMQKSVFVVNLRSDRLVKVVEELRRICGKKDVIDIVPICGNCRRQSIRLGAEAEAAIVVLGTPDESDGEESILADA